MRRALFRLLGLLCMIIIPFIVYYSRQEYDSFYGCTQSLLKKFEQNPVILQYKTDYGKQLIDDGYTLGGYSWEIKKQGNGCIVEFTGSAQEPSHKITWFQGDKFFIDLKTMMVYPQSEGANLIFSKYGNSISLLHEPVQNTPTTIVTKVVFTTVMPVATRWSSLSDLLLSNCFLWSEITLNDIGKEICVYGKVFAVRNTKDAFYITFSKNSRKFALLSYKFIFPEVKKDDCVMVTGIIAKVNNRPVIKLTSENELYQCTRK